MSPPFKRGVKKNIKAIFGCCVADQPGAQHQNIRVIVLTRQLRRQVIVTQRRTDVRLPVGRHCHADSRPAQENAARGRRRNRRAQRRCNIGIINRRRIVRSHIMHRKAPCGECRPQVILERNGGVVAANHNGSSRRMRHVSVNRQQRGAASAICAL